METADYSREEFKTRTAFFSGTRPYCSVYGKRIEEHLLYDAGLDVFNSAVIHRLERRLTSVSYEASQRPTKYQLVSGFGQTRCLE